MMTLLPWFLVIIYLQVTVLRKRLKAAVENAESGKGATVFGYYVDDPERFGIVEFNNEAKGCLYRRKSQRSLRATTV